MSGHLTASMRERIKREIDHYKMSVRRVRITCAEADKHTNDLIEKIEGIVSGAPDKKYSHVFALAFTVESDHDAEHTGDIPPAVIAKAIYARVQNLLECGEIHEAIGPPCDTAEEEA